MRSPFPAKMQAKQLSLLLLPLATLCHANQTFAQIVPSTGTRTPVADNTLGTQVNNNGNNFNITGGLQRGQNLFHSFQDFSIPTNGAANFFNPANNQSIITRVTGNNFSDLNGILNSNGANFLLINPNGIVFGPNVQLNVGKSFIASTANSIDLVDGGGGRYNFGARNGNDAPLISLNPNVFFNVSKFNIVNGNNSGIINYGNLSPNNASQYISLIGGNVNFIGGKITAAGGRVDIGGINTNGEVSITNTGLVFTGDGVVRSNFSMSNGGFITVRATNTLNPVDPVFVPNATSNGSTINVIAGDLSLVNAGANSNNESAALDAGLETNSGVKTNPSGDIKLDATGLITLDKSGIKNTLRTGASGKIGDIKINSNGLNLVNAAVISTTIGGTGSGGKIEIESIGDINISSTSINSTAPITLDSPLSVITSNTLGRGDAGRIKIGTTGKLAVLNGGSISSSVVKDAVGNSQGIAISARDVELRNLSDISSNTQGLGNAGNIDIKATRNIDIIGSNTPNPQGFNSGEISEISSQTNGQGNAGKISIEAQGKLSLINQGRIRNIVNINGVGNAQDLTVTAGSLDLNDGIISSGSFGQGNSGNLTIATTTGGINLTNDSSITTVAQGRGNAGNIKINSVGDLKISSGDVLNSDGAVVRSGSLISAATSGMGDAGKIEIDTQGKLSLLNSNISSTIGQNAVGNSQGITISAREVDLSGTSLIFSDTFGKGDAGNVEVKTTGNITLNGLIEGNSQNPSKIGLAKISSDTAGEGNAGIVKVDTQGKLSLANKGFISTSIGSKAVGNGKNISITAREIDIRNGGQISSLNSGGKGNTARIDIKTTGDISIAGSTPESTAPITNNVPVSGIATFTSGQGDTGAISIDTQGKLSLANRAVISSDISVDGVGNANNVTISARDLNLSKSSFISSGTSGTGNAGNISLKIAGDVSIAGSTVTDNNPITNTSPVSGILTASSGQGKAGNIEIEAKGKVTLASRGGISSNSTGSRGGDLALNVGEYLLLRNQGNIFTDSGSNSAADNGGNITINSPLIIATPGNNNITANANAGNGGRVQISSQGLFGIAFRPNGINSPLTNDITASSTFGQSGIVKVDTPDIDPGKDSAELPKTPTDKSNQISQTCSPSQQDNKFYVTGRGGIAPTADDSLTSDEVWLDDRNSTPTAQVPATITATAKPRPAQGWVFTPDGKVRLVASGDAVQPMKTLPACPVPAKDTSRQSKAIDR
jgi:filamentous hemagglutinin family protein